MVKQYKMLESSNVESHATKNTIVYECIKPDYGLASDESMLMGEDCISLTLDPTGDYPFFVVPMRIVELV